MRIGRVCFYFIILFYTILSIYLKTEEHIRVGCLVIAIEKGCTRDVPHCQYLRLFET